MIIQAISLLDELDKEINIYAMRVKEWYGWHFPEMQKIVLDIQYAKVILKMSYRKTAHDLDFSDILEESGCGVGHLMNRCGRGDEENCFDLDRNRY